jgi:hypothetical protein
MYCGFIFLHNNGSPLWRRLLPAAAWAISCGCTGWVICYYPENKGAGYLFFRNNPYFYPMNKWLLCSAALLCSIGSRAQQNDSLTARKISNQILDHGRCYSDLRTLCKTIGHRLSGSPQADAAVRWAYNTMRDEGFDSVWLQPVRVPVWKRGPERLSLKFDRDGDYYDVRMLSLGNSEGTGGRELERRIVMVNSFEEFKELDRSEVENKIVFFNYRFRQDLPNTFNGYGDAVKYRWMSPMVAAEKGAAAVIIRSVSTGLDDEPHTGSMRYADTIRHIPEVAIGNTTANKLEKACKRGYAKAILQSDCGMQGTKMSYNVIGEMRGTEHPDEYLIVGGHLDSWDVGEGAHDDGAGCVQSIEVLRTFKALGIRPKHSIRAVLFMNEENGLKGGAAYADSVRSRGEKHLLAIESDAGGFAPRGFGFEVSAAQRDRIRQYAKVLLPYGVYDVESDGGGADISPLRKLGVPVGELMPDSQRYFDLHHTDADVFETVNHRELKLGAVAMTIMIYLADSHNLP